MLLTASAVKTPSQSKAQRTKECAGYTGAEMTAPSMEEMNKLIEEELPAFRPVLAGPRTEASPQA